MRLKKFGFTPFLLEEHVKALAKKTDQDLISRDFNHLREKSCLESNCLHKFSPLELFISLHIQFTKKIFIHLHKTAFFKGFYIIFCTSVYLLSCIIDLNIF